MPLRAASAAALAVVLATGVVSAAVLPYRTVSASLPVRDLALAGSSVAYVADAGPTRLRCARIGLWYPVSGQRYSFDAKEQCLELASTGQGVWDVAVAKTRVLWISYAGGNIREWTLWTATTTRRTPRRLRFVARDVDAPAPVVLGPGTAEGVPYAVDRQIVYLGDDGKAIFRTTVDSPVRLLVADARGRSGVVVLAALANGRVVGLDRSGLEVLHHDYPAGAVTAIGLDSLHGAAIQTVDRVTFPGPSVRLPRGATMVDVAQDRVLWTRAGDLGATTIATGRSVRLVDGTNASPVSGQIDGRGLAWARGTVVRWRGGRLP
jgi:hypothetical protein